MKLAIAATALLLAAVVPGGVQATRTKAPVNTTCPLLITIPTQNQFIQSEGGYIILTVQNPSGASVSGVTVSYDLSTSMVTGFTGANAGLIALPPGSNKAGVRGRGKSSPGAPAPVITSNGRVVTYSGFTVGGTSSLRWPRPIPPLDLLTRTRPALRNPQPTRR